MRRKPAATYSRMHDMKQRSPRYAPHNTTTIAICIAIALTVFSQAASAQQPPQTAPQAARGGAWQMPSSTAPAATPAPAAAQPAPAPQPTAYAPQYTKQYTKYPPYQPPAPVQGSASAGSDQPVDEEINPDDPPNFDLMVGTQVPLSVGAIAALELPGRILLSGELGWMPRAYGSAINGVVSSLGAYNDNVRDLVDGTLEDALVVRISGGWRPFPSAGFEMFGGYTHIALSGSVSPQTIAGIAGGEVAQLVAAQGLSQDVLVSSGLHNFHVGLGWRWVAFDHLVIRASIAYTQTLASSSSVETPDVPELGTLATPFIDKELDTIYGDYVKLPLLGLAAGYRF